MEAQISQNLTLQPRAEPAHMHRYTYIEYMYKPRIESHTILRFLELCITTAAD